MSVKVKLGELVNAVEGKALFRLSQAEGLPFKSAYDAVKLLKRAQEEYNDFVEARNKLIKELGVSKDGGPHSIEPGTEGMRNYVTQLSALLETEVELPVSAVVLPAATDAKCELKPIDLILLEKFVKVPE